MERTLRFENIFVVFFISHCFTFFGSEEAKLFIFTPFLKTKFIFIANPSIISPTMRLSMRFIIPLVVVLGLIGAALMPLTERLALRWFTRDFETRSDIIATTI